MTDKSFRARKILGLCLRIAVTLVIIGVIIWKYNDLVHIDVRALIEKSSSELAAAGTVEGVYLLKSILFVIPASIIYTSVGVAFKMWKALVINAAGIIIEVSATWLFGRILGGDQVEKLLRRSKKGEKLLKVKNTSKYSVILGIRALPVFPIDFVSLFLGASKMKFLPYLGISFLGIMPRVALFTILGGSIYDYFPMKYIVIGVIAIVCAGLVFWVIRYGLSIRKGRPWKYEGVIQSKKPVILDTDFGPDCDDAGALAVLLRLLGDNGMCPLGVVNCTSNKNSNGAIKAVLRFCGFSGIPVAQTSRKDFFADTSCYTPKVAEKYLGKDADLSAEESLAFYHRVLSEAKKDSVVIVSIGMLNNISELVDAYPELVKEKVHALISMAAEFPKGHEYNIYADTKAARNVFDNFPAPIICSGYEIGKKVKAGFEDKPENHEVNALYDCYRLYCKGSPVREAWDLTAVQFAAEGEGDYYSVSGRVKITIDEDGNNSMKKDGRSDRFYLKLNAKPEAVSERLNALLRSYDTVKE